MNKEQYDALVPTLREEVDVFDEDVSPNELADQSDRVLVYGYTTDRDTFSVSLEDGLFVGRCYSGVTDDPPVAWRSTSPAEGRSVALLVPNKRIYPHKSDADFLKLLHERGAMVSLGNWPER